jgi:hypothetical protein
MVIAFLAFLVALGLWFQSGWFVLWVLLLVTPALLFFVKVFEERELEIRFGETYREYKAQTPMLIPRRPKPPVPAPAKPRQPGRTRVKKRASSPASKKRKTK